MLSSKTAAMLPGRSRLRFAVVASVLLLVVASVNALPFFSRGLPLADDVDVHLSYVQAIANEGARGNYYPHWLPTLNQGGGSPIFFLQYPLPYVVALAMYAPVRLFTGPGFNSIATPLSAMVSALLLAISGWTAFLWLRSFTSQYASLLGALVFVSAPYHFSVDIYRRWALGEMTCYAAFPLLLLFTRGISSRENWRRHLAGFAVAFTLVTSAHLITAMIISPAVLLELWLASGKRPVLHLVARLAAAGAVGLLLSAFYLFTFLSHYHEVDKYPFTSAPLEYDANYLFLPAVMFHKAEASIDSRPALPSFLKTLGHRTVEVLGVFGEERPFPTMTPMAALYSMVFTLAAALVCLLASPRVMGMASARVWGIAGLVSIFLQWHGSHWIGDRLTLIKQIQFPWRLSIITSTCLAVLAGCAWDALGDASKTNRFRVLALTGGVLILMGLGNWAVIRKFCPFRQEVKISGNDSAYQIYTNRTVDDLAGRSGLQPLALVASQPPLNPSAWRANEINSREFRVSLGAAQATHVVVNLICFPGWMAMDERTGKSVPLGCDPRTPLRTLDIAPGEYVLRFFLPLHRADYVGPVITFLTILGLWYFCLRPRYGRPTTA